MGKVLLTPEEETNALLRESRELRERLKEGCSVSSKGIKRVIRKMITLIKDQTDFLAMGSNIDRRLRLSLEREIIALVGEAIEAARKEEPAFRRLRWIDRGS